MRKKKTRKPITKAGAKERRLETANLNQKASIFKDKRTKRNRTRKTQNETAIKEQVEK